MKFKVFRQYFSSARISRYLTASGNSTIRTTKLYIANLKLSQAFHTLLGVIEVVFRNRINDILIAHFTDPDWIINQKTGFMADPTLRFIYKRTGQQRTNDFLIREVLKAEKRLRKAGIAITSGKVLAEQTLGFWTDLFEVHHYKLLKGKPIQIFKTIPSGYGRKEICDELNKIRHFRNHINYNEPICFSGNVIDFSNAIDVYNSIRNILTWIDPELLKLIKELDNVIKTIKIAQKI
jgi:hypothetical protein